MDTLIIVFSCVAAFLLVSLVLTTLVLVARIRALEDMILEVAQSTPPAKIEETAAKMAGVESKVDTQLVELGKFRQAIHGEVQRLYAIMRRKEKAAGFVQGAQEGEEEVIPDEIDPKDLGEKEAPKEPGKTNFTRAELRAKMRKSG